LPDLLAVDQMRRVEEIIANVLVNLQPDAGEFQIRVILLDVSAPFMVLPLRLVQIDSFVDVGFTGGRSDEVASLRKVLADVAKYPVEIGRGNVFHYFPGGDEIKLRRLVVNEDLEWPRDVAGEEMDVGERGPVGTTVLERVIGSFKANGDPFQVEKIFDHLASGTAKIEAAQRTSFQFGAEQFIHVQDELFVRAVVFCSSFGRDMIGRLEGDRVFRLQRNGGRRARAGRGTTTPLKKPDYFVDKAVDSNMDFVPNTPELARRQKTDGAPNISQKQADFFHCLDFTRSCSRT